MKSILHSFIILISATFIFISCKKETKHPPVANAGNSQTVQLKNSIVTLTGSGISQNGAITGYIWSLVSGPNVPIIVSPSSSTTVVNDIISGIYVFQLLVTDNIGLTDTDTVSIIVQPSPIITVTFQPVNNSDEINFAGNSGRDLSDKGNIDFDAGAWTGGGETYFLRGAFKFDLSSIPSNANIVSAKLSLFSNTTPVNGNLIDANFGSNNSMYLRRISTNWNVAGATWQNQPSTETEEEILIPHTDLAFLDLTDIDVTKLVTRMHTINNYGFMISLQNEVIYTIRQFASSKHPDANKHPKLVIVYE